MLMLWLVLKLFAKTAARAEGAMNNGLCYFYIYRFRNRRRIFLLGLEHKDLLDEILMSALYFMVLLPVSKSAETGIL